MSSEATAAERRQHERKPVNGNLQLVAEAGSCDASVLDVSEGGLRVRSSGAPGDWGAAVVLRRVGATEDGVRCHIVRVLPDEQGVQLGLRFDRAEPDSHRRLLELLA